MRTRSASVLAENVSGAVVFEDPDHAKETLGSLRVRPEMVEACVYRADGTLLAAYQRSMAGLCPAQPADEHGWLAVGSRVPVINNNAQVGTVYVQRTLADLSGRVFATLLAGGLVLLVAGALAFGLARLLQRTISRPIIELAAAAREIGVDEPYQMRPVAAAPDETGELVQAFHAMVDRLLSANEALRHEIDARARMQAEREGLLAREREASRLKDEFLAAVSHELRTPLNAIVGWTHVLASGDASKETIARATEVLARNARAQQRVIDDLIDMSRIMTGKLQLKTSLLDLRGVIESSIDVVAPAALGKRIALEATLPLGACLVQGDHDRLRQVVWNLLSNAIKFTPPGGVVRVSLVEDAEAYAIVVSDTGIGIRSDFLPHVFERFRQADGSTTREHGGLGLGLAIVKELTELHGGTVTAASGGLGQGATLTVSLRRLTGAATGAAPKPEPIVVVAPVDPAVRLDGLQVLAVDDNPDGLALVLLALGGAGASVRLAGSGQEALTLSAQALPDVVLCDLAMPQMDGFEVLRRLLLIAAAAGRRPIALAVSAYATSEYRERSINAGFTAYLTKPLDSSELVHAVKAAVDRA